MSSNFSELLEALSQNWRLVLAFVSILVYAKFGPIPRSYKWWCPSMVTLSGSLLRLFSFFVLLIHPPTFVIGAFVYALGAGFDVIDGRLARKNGNAVKAFPSFRKAFFHGGKTDYGAIWDSSNDKATLIPIYIYVSLDMLCRGYKLIALIFTLSALVDLVSGLRKLTEFKEKLHTGGNHSQRVGKAKSWVQQLSLIPWVFLSLVGEVTLLVSVSTALLLTVGSVLEQRLFNRQNPPDVRKDM